VADAVAVTVIAIAVNVVAATRIAAVAA
ncbi:hypothetical protein A2U01_0101270, partial [Trifolium medium]|nr:hypothetical protein [Trifolium medium]